MNEGLNELDFLLYNRTAIGHDWIIIHSQNASYKMLLTL